MNINALSTATNMITSAQQQTENATQTIAKMPLHAQEVGGPGELKSTDYVPPLVSLKEAEFQVKAGVKIIQADQEMQDSIGSIINTKA